MVERLDPGIVAVLDGERAIVILELAAKAPQHTDEVVVGIVGAPERLAPVIEGRLGDLLGLGQHLVPALRPLKLVLVENILAGMEGPAVDGIRNRPPLVLVVEQAPYVRRSAGLDSSVESIVAARVVGQFLELHGDPFFFADGVKAIMNALGGLRYIVQ